MKKWLLATLTIVLAALVLSAPAANAGGKRGADAGAKPAATAHPNVTKPVPVTPLSALPAGCNPPKAPTSGSVGFVCKGTPVSTSDSFGYCTNLGGCWKWNASYEAEWNAVTPYGYVDRNGAHVLGTVTSRIVDKLRGSILDAPRNYWENDRVSLQSGIMAAERLYLSGSCPNGCSVTPTTYDIIGPETKAVNVRMQWQPTARPIWSARAEVAYAVDWHRWQWRDSRHAGKWFIWVKGPKVVRHGTKPNYTYSYTKPLQHAPETSGSGWTP